MDRLAMIFKNRQDAGIKLAHWLLGKALPPIDIVLGLPRGGVLVAVEVAKILRVSFDLVLVRKLGLAGHSELAMGAIGEDFKAVLNDDIISFYNVSQSQIDHEIRVQSQEIARRKKLYEAVRPGLHVTGKSVLLVDDGLATGASMRAAITTLRQKKVGWLGCAVPVGAADSCRLIEGIVDGFYCYQMPIFFSGVGQWYQDFRQTTDAEVTAIMKDILLAS